jgi:hypothetical protein
MCMKPEIIAERFVRIHGLLSALGTVASANAELNDKGYSGVIVLIGEVEKAAHALEVELTVCAQQQQTS